MITKYDTAKELIDAVACLISSEDTEIAWELVKIKDLLEKRIEGELNLGD